MATMVLKFILARLIIIKKLTLIMKLISTAALYWYSY